MPPAKRKPAKKAPTVVPRPAKDPLKRLYEDPEFQREWKKGAGPAKKYLCSNCRIYNTVAATCKTCGHARKGNEKTL